MNNPIIKIYEQVQKIPYRVCKFDSSKINLNMKFGDCRHKSELLKQLLEKKGFEVMKMKVFFDWKDLPIPENILSTLKKSTTIWAHDLIKVKIKENWVKIDCTWNPELINLGFPVTKNWNGLDDTKQVTEGLLKFIEEDENYKKPIIEWEEAKRFAKELNNFICRKNKLKNQHAEGDWTSTLSKIMNPIFSQDQFQRYLERHKEKLNFYEQYIPGKKVLEIGCGFGYTSVPLSNLGFDMTVLDNDSKIISNVKENAKNYGKNMRVVEGDIFNLPKIFEKNSFDASISGGLLEHFNKEEIEKIIEFQLMLAPIVIIDVPIHQNKKTLKAKYSDFKKKICLDGVFRNLWDSETWLKEILKKFKIIYSEVSISSKNTGNFEKLTIVIKREND